MFPEGKKQNFERFGFSLKSINEGFVIYMKQESFNLIHGSESCLILENENW